MSANGGEPGFARTSAVPPTGPLTADERPAEHATEPSVASSATGRWQHRLPDGRVQCDLCPRHCALRDGQRGFCFVRSNHHGTIMLDTYGRSSGFAMDPVEKKPLNHFHPGSAVLSFGTAGCNSACRYCQNWSISASRQWSTLAVEASPENIAAVAADYGAQSVAFTYNDPIIFAEYAIDTAQACHELGINAIAVTAGYMSDASRADFYRVMDAANIDLKGFTEDFYRSVTGTRLRDVLDTIAYACNETDTWVELTTLLIPGYNDDDAQLHAECAWIREHCGRDVPLHFSAFHPDYKMRDVPPTPLATLVHARGIAMGEGLRFVYTGNVVNRDGDTTFCPGCGAALIVRDRYDIVSYRLSADGHCPDCGSAIPGRWDADGAGGFGRRRWRVAMR
ncbi:AmmeMemoRadiSam system radical SAM enzyme [Bifidobacterium sp. 82T10]|uniref:AmmeMemoRadiSam system radical SAM enzyme n=1 Tax=Bifidobacterium miconis TaxID=2834435 RepID=A0ABS6WE24_9BIFI|nr:AmmeMemoRadiSam system radical SAM enzyme [Bifidobacterium miconis]MBW3092285.1 AmmeMemoRadiSam system radical SAM enzyme [Bifidobacterium miconis]